jgi:hypothetical protein
MASMQVDILNPKAGKILRDLADLNLIAITELKKDDGFLKIIKKIRVKSKKNPISLEDITKEVESVRAKRYARTKR